MDIEAGHRHFSGSCFNEVWGLLEKAARSKEEDRLMREMAHASLYHWLQRKDCDPTKISIGLWLLSRVYATLGRAAAATKYAQECMDVSKENTLPAFYLGYAFEAAARAAKIEGNGEALDRFMKEAHACVSRIDDPEEKGMLSADLDALKSE